MNVKSFVFRFIVGTLAFSLSIGVYFIWQKLTIKTVAQSTSLVKPVIQISETKSVVESLDSLPSTNIEVSTEKVESEEYPFYPDGEFYTNTNLTKEFIDFRYIEVEANDWEKASEENDYKPLPIIPKGFLLTNKKFKFIKINLGNRLISFKTETRNGISYKFIGEYPNNKNLNTEDEWIELKGTLTKYKNSKKVASQKMKLYVPGC